MEKQYEIIKTKNGFIIKFNHEKEMSFYDKNKRVAFNLNQVLKIIKEDINNNE